MGGTTDLPKETPMSKPIRLVRDWCVEQVTAIANVTGLDTRVADAARRLERRSTRSDLTEAA